MKKFWNYGNHAEIAVTLPVILIQSPMSASNSTEIHFQTEN